MEKEDTHAGQHMDASAIHMSDAQSGSIEELQEIDTWEEQQQLWAGVLNLEPESIAPSDNFFRLGGDSIAAMKLVAEARKQNIPLTVASIFEHPKLTDLANWAEGAVPAMVQKIPSFSLLGINSDTEVDVATLQEEVANICGVEKDVVRDIYPCSPLQEGMMSLTLKRSGDYIMQGILELRDDIDEDSLRAAWEQLVMSSPVLRTRIVLHSTLGLLQVVIKEGVQWIEADNLMAYQTQDKSTVMGLGDRLARFAFIKEKFSNKRYIVWTIHHALYDGWSLPRIFETVRNIYQGLAVTEDTGFNAFILDILSLDLGEAAKYWQNVFSGCEAVLFPSSIVQQPVADAVLEHICNPINAESDMTLSTLIRTAWAIITSSYTNSDDIVFGTTVSGRNAPIPGIEAMLGPTIATVPVRIQLSRDWTIRALLEKVQRQATEMIPYEQTGLQRIAKMGLDTQHACNFQTLLVIQPTEDGFSSDQGFGVWQSVSGLQDFTTYSLMIQCTLVKEGMKITASFDQQAIQDWEVEKILRQFSFVMQQIADANCEMTVGDIDVLTPEDIQQLSVWNQKIPLPEERCIHDLFADKVKVEPLAQAISSWDGEMTYGELDELSSGLASYLVGQGVEPEVIVPLCFEKSMWTIVAMLAVLKAGGAFLLLDPSLPHERLRLMCDKVSGPLALSSRSNKEVVEPLVRTVLVVESHSIRQIIPHIPRTTFVQPANTAYIIFTSGSTGQPKGCRIIHQAACSSLLRNDHHIGMQESTRTLQFGSYSFAGSLAEILLTLTHGGCICILSEEERRTDLALAMRRMKTNWAFLTATVVELLTPESVPSLATLCVGGEPVRTSQIAQWGAKVHLRQTYGSSETSGFVSSSKLTESSASKIVGHGRTGIFWIVNPKNHNILLPIGAIGEVLIEGPILGQEYLGDPEKTTSTFIQPPEWRNRMMKFSGQQRFYKTGDLGRLREDGSLELIGRKDNQVKLRGQRIELEEIENQAQMAKAGTKEIIVELIKRPEGAESQLTCFIIMNDSTDAVEKDEEHKRLKTHTKQAIRMIQERLDRFLPQYMVPTAFIPISRLPLTWSGKVDRKRLRDIGASISNQQLVDLQASKHNVNRQLSKREKELQWLWACVLGIERNNIGLHDSFFRLGGDSVAAMKLVVEARKQDLHLTVATIFHFPKLIDLASWVNECAPAAMHDITAFSLLNCDSDAEKTRVRDEVATICNLSRDQIQDLYPGSPLQEGLISLTLKRAGNYVMQNVLNLRDSIDEAAFRKAWEQVVLSSSVLRTRIVQHRKGILQAVVADGIRWIEADSLTTYQAMDKSIPMGLGTPLARYALIKDHGSRWFVWTIHHALYDGWSLPRIVSAVERAYNGATIPKQLGFNSFIQYLIQQDEGEAEKYWQATFAGCEPTPFPPLPPTVQQPIADAIVEYRCPELPKIVSDITTSSLLRAAWAIVVGSYTSSDDIVYGATVTGRNAPVAGIESILGPAIATVPIRIRIPKEDTVSAFLKTVQQQATDMIMYEQTGLQRIFRMGVDSQRACSFQTLLVVQLGQGLEESKELGRWQSSVELQDFTTYALMLQCTISGQEVQLTASFDPRVIEQWQVERMLGQFSYVMHQLAEAEANVGSTISDITILTPDDRRQLWIWNQNVPVAAEQSIPELFSAQANHLPDAPAIHAWDGELTYNELDDLSSRLASYLVHEQEVEREEIIVLYFEKSMWTIVAMFAVLKAGGAFTPLDPDHPTSRHGEILRQTRARIVLTSEKYSERCRSTGRTVIEVSSSAMKRLHYKRDDTLLRAGLDQRAYILFTSGSTGTPKGVTIEHRAFSTSCSTHGKAFAMSPYTRALQFTPYTADISIAEIFTTLLYGGCVCVISDEERKDSLASAIENMRVNWAYLTPTVARLLDCNAVPSLETLLLGGEPVSSGECEKWIGRVLLINTYGPTECSVLCSAFFGTESFYTGLIGKSIASVSWVVNPNDHDKLSPLGSVGELLIEGSILGRGYLNDKEKTAAAFISDPVWLLEGSEQLPGHGRHGRLYKTGDLVRYDKNGNLVCVGRKDTQVKIRGQRVELEDIEHHLRECMPDAKQIAVEVILPGGEKEKGVVAAFLQLEKGAPNDDLSASIFFPVEVDRQLSERLPSYMIPAVYFKVCKLPMTTSGKTNRKQLREIGASFSAQNLAELQTRRQVPKRQPSSEKEKLFQELWARVLNIEADSIGIDDSFFRLGGDSITAMQVSSSARSLHISVSTGDILQHKTIRRLVRHTTSTLTSPKTWFEDPTNKSFGLTPIQDLYLRIESSGRASFDQCFLFELSRLIDFKLLCLSFKTIVQRHSIFRARFDPMTGGGWQQRISDCTDNSFVVENVPGIDNESIRQAVCQSRCFLDAHSGPTLAAVLFDGDQRQFLSVAIHHLVIDLVSWRILLQELEDLLLSQALPPAPQIPFQAWQALQAEHASKSERVIETTESGAVLGQPLSYWGVQSHDILLGHVTTTDFTLDKQTTSDLLGSCNDTFQTRPVELMLAALLHSFATAFPHRALPVVFNESHGRETWDDSIDLSRTLGWFTSMSPVKLPSHIRGNLLDCIRHTKDQMRTFTDSGRSYFASCFKDAETAKAFASMFPVEIMFNYQGKYQQLERKNSLFKAVTIPAGSKPEAMSKTPRFALFDISVSVQNGCLNVSVASDRRVDHQQQIKAWVDQYKVNLFEMKTLLRGKRREWTLSDLPVSFQSYQDIDRFQKHFLPGLGVQPEEVEDVYPCLPMQEGILISQSKDKSAYWVSIIFEALPMRHNQPSCAQLQQAWKSVVHRHSLLRTMFVKIPGIPGTMNVILNDPHPSMSIFQASGDIATIEMFSAHHTFSHQDSSLQHHMSICKLDNGKIYLCLKINHAIFDAHSRGIILRDLQTAYNSELNQNAAQFKDAVSYLSQQKDDVEARTYWATYLDDVEPCSFPLITDTKTTHSRNGTVHVSGVDAKTIHAFCEAWDVTPATIIQTAWALVLSRYTGSTTPCFGNLSSRRDLPLKDVENIFGPLITILTCRVRLGEGQTVLDVLKAVQSDFTSSIPHQRLPLASIHNMLRLGTSRLFNTILSLQRIEEKAAEDTSDVIFRVHEGTDPTEYDIMIGALYNRSTVNIEINYQTHCINQSQASNLAESFSRAVNAIITEPKSTMSNLEILSASQRLQIWDWNGEVPVAVQRCVHDVFAEQAKARPLAPAICAWDGDMSYSELDKLSSNLSEHLIDLGITSEDIVPLCFEKSMWTVVAMLAVLKAGGAFTPLDPEYPASRHVQIIQQTKAKLVLASTQYSDFCQSNHSVVVTVSKASVLQLPHKDSKGMNRRPNTSISGSAYVIFTSGSTGTPKGVVVEHKAISTSCLAQGKAFQLSCDTRGLQYANYTFDASITEILAILIHGGCICVPSDGDRHNNLSSIINTLNANWVLLTATVAQVLDPKSITSLKTLVLGGEQINSVDWDRWNELEKRINTYGPTECSVWCTSHSNEDGFTSGMIGKAMACVSWVVDPSNHNRLAPINSIGELLIEGPILARGYLDDKEKTTTAFIYNPPWLLEGSKQHLGRHGRLYKTGDLVRYNSDGSLVYIGRKDTQVKVRGQRVELGEIEHYVRQYLNVEQMAVEVIVPGNDKTKSTVAVFLQREEKDSLDDRPLALTGNDPSVRVFFAAEVDRKLSKQLPSYMVPTVYFCLTQLPMTTSGKMDRKQLRKIGASFSTQQLAELKNQGPKEQPTTGQEKILQQLWARVLDIDTGKIGLDDSFLHLGGDSVGAMKLVAEARKQDITLTTANVFETPILRDMARTAKPFASNFRQPSKFSELAPDLYKAIFSSGIQCNPPLPLDAVEDIHHISFIQDLCLKLGEQDPRAAFTHFYVNLNPSISTELLEKSCQVLAEYFSTFRTHFAYFEGHLLQFVLRKFHAPYVKFELTEPLEEASNSLILQDIHQASPLGVPTSFIFLRNSSKAARLIIRLSHAQYDGVSLPLVLEALASLLRREPLRPTINFSTYLAYSRQRAAESTRYWRDLLKGSRLTEIIPVLSSNIPMDEAPCNIVLAHSISIQQLPKGITTASLVSAAWAIMVSQISKEEDVVYVHVVGGRNSNLPGIEEIVGPCVNMVPIRAKVSRTSTTAQLLHSIQEQQIGLQESDSMGFSDIVQKCTDWPAGTTLDSLVNHHIINTTPGIDLAGDVVKLQTFDNPFHVTSRIAILWELQEGKLNIMLCGNTHIFTASCAQKLLDTISETVVGLTSEAEVTLDVFKQTLPLFP